MSNQNNNNNISYSNYTLFNRIKRHFVESLKNAQTWFYIFVIVVLYVFETWLFTTMKSFLQNEKTFTINSFLIVITVFCFFLLIKDTRSLHSFLIFIIAVKLLSTIFAILGHDINLFLDGLPSQVIDSSSIIFTGCSLMLNSGITLLSFALFLFLIVSSFINFIDYRLLIKLHKTSTRVSWFILLTISETLLFFAIFYAINIIYINWVSDEFTHIIQKSSVSPWFQASLANIFSILKTIINFAWFPTLIAINQTRGTDILLSKNSQIYFAILIVFFNNSLRNYFDSPTDLFVPITIVGYTAFKITYHFTLFIITLVRCIKFSQTKKEDYIPLKISSRLVVNPNVSALIKAKITKTQMHAIVR